MTLLVIRHEGRLARIEAKCWHVGAGDLTGALRVLRVPVVTSCLFHHLLPRQNPERFHILVPA